MRRAWEWRQFWGRGRVDQHGAKNRSAKRMENGVFAATHSPSGGQEPAAPSPPWWRDPRRGTEVSLPPMAASSQELVEWPEMARDRADEVQRDGEATDLPRMAVDLARTWRGFTPARASAMAGRENPFRQEFRMPEAGNTLTLETTQGQVVIDMRPDLAPAHVAHIKKLAGEKFYDGIVFHRVIEGFMAQTGCPPGTRTR